MKWLEHLSNNSAFYKRAALSFILFFVSVILGLVMRIYQVLLGGFPIRGNLWQLLHQLGLSLIPITLPVVCVVALIFFAVRRPFLKICSVIGLLILALFIFILQIPGAAGLGGAGVAIMGAILISIIIVFLITLTIIENVSETTKRNKSVFIFNIVLVFLATVLLGLMIKDAYANSVDRTVLEDVGTLAAQNLPEALKQCDKLTTEQYGGPKYDCLEKVAVAVGDISICPINTPIRGDTCVTNVARKLKDIKICTNIQQIPITNTMGTNQQKNNKAANESKKWLCARESVQEATNPDICLETEDGIIRDTCLLEIARNHPNMNTCARINTEDTRNWCYSMVIPKVGTREDCNIITIDQNPFDRQRCEDVFTQPRAN